MSLVEINGKQLHILTIKGNRPDLPVALFLHGLLIGSSAGWYLGIASKLQDFCHVILLDFPGHGLSEKTKNGYDSESLILDVSSVLSLARQSLHLTESINQTYLIGHSYGAWIALKYASRFPDQIKGIVLVELPLPPKLSDLPIQATDAASILSSLPIEIQQTLLKGKRQGIKLFESLSFLLMQSSLLSDLALETDLEDHVLSQLPFHKLVIYAKSSTCIVALPRLQQLFTCQDLDTQFDTQFKTQFDTQFDTQFKTQFKTQFEVVEGGHFILNENAMMIEALIRLFIQSLEGNHG